jgi:hypothetical protein
MTLAIIFPGTPHSDSLNAAETAAMIAFALSRCDKFHWPTRGWLVEHAGRKVLMASQPVEASAAQVSPWTCSTTCSRSYQAAAMRAAIIALVLLGILALVVLF